MFFYLSISLTIISVLLSHVFQKSISGTVNPIISLIFTYITAIIICLITLVIFPPQKGLGESWNHLNWATFALAFAILGIDIGYILAYRFGWSLSLSSIIPPVGATVILIIVGVCFFQEKITFTNLIGIFFCTIGLIFVNQK